MRTVDEARRAARREQILDAARRCFARHGYEGATIVRLERETGLSRGAIFHYFADKEELFAALAARDSARFTELWVEHGYEELLRAIAAESADWLAVHFEVLRRVRTDPDFAQRLAAGEEERAARFRAALERRRAEGAYRRDVPLDTLAVFLNVFANGLAVRRAAGEPIPQVKALMELLTSGMGGPSGAPASEG